jgi:hypothetical protein
MVVDLVDWFVDEKIYESLAHETDSGRKANVGYGALTSRIAVTNTQQ